MKSVKSWATFWRNNPANLYIIYAQAQPRITDTPPVIVAPGLWASDRTMWVLRRYLKKCGYDAQGWGLGRNFAGRGWSGEISDLSEGWAKGERDRLHRGEANVPALCDQFAAEVKRRSDELGRPIALVGWSLGGRTNNQTSRQTHQMSRYVDLFETRCHCALECLNRPMDAACKTL